MFNLIIGDCLQELPKLESNSIDLILTDLPYGVTNNDADICLPLDKLWIEWKRILHSNGVVVLTAQFPYTIDLILSNRSWFRYDLVWDKVLTSGFLNANRMPLRSHEQILVFYKNQPNFYPQKSVGEKSHSVGKLDKQPTNNNYGKFGYVDNSEKHGCLKFPTSIIKISKPHSSVAFHPTEKPVELAEYLIKTYTAEGDTVLDCCMGVGWSAVASKRLNRNFIGIDINSDYVATTRKRVDTIPSRLEAFASVCENKMGGDTAFSKDDSQRTVEAGNP